MNTERHVTDIQTSIKQFLSQHIKNYDLQQDEDFFALGFVNSLFAMQLVLFVEKKFRITVEEQDLKIDNFLSIGALTNFVEQKLSSTQITREG